MWRMQRIIPIAFRRMIAIVPVVALAACGAAAAPAAGHAGQAASQHAGRQPVRHAIADRAPASIRPRQPAATPTAARTAGGRNPAGQAAGPTVPGASNCPLFPANNIWNTDISKLPVAAHSAAWLRSMNSAGTYLHPDFGPDPGGYPYGIPFIYVTNAHPKVRIAFQYASESNKGPYPFGADTPIEGGPKAGGDRHALMVDSSTCTLYELWNAHYSPRRSTAGSGAIWNLRSNALRPAGWTSADAAGLPIMPGLLNFGQIKWAVRTGTPIRHAIRFTAERTRSAYIWPARHEAGSGGSLSLPPMGARFRLKASFNVAGFCRRSTPYCADAKVVLVEMQHYGLILADNGSNWYFQGSAFPKWPDALVELLKQIPARAFEAVSTSCLMVSRNSGEARARPGCPIG